MSSRAVQESGESCSTASRLEFIRRLLRYVEIYSLFGMFSEADGVQMGIEDVDLLQAFPMAIGG